MLKPITGTWFEFRHHNTAEGKYWNNVCRHFSKEQWKAKIAEIASVGMKYIVLMASALKTEEEEECYFETDIFPLADMDCRTPMQTMFEASDENNIKVFVSCGFYGVWTQPLNNITSHEVTELAFKAMKQIYSKYGHHKSFYGWYYPDEICINKYFSEEFIDYVNRYSDYAHKISPGSKTLIAPYGTQFAVPDEKYTEQLKCLDVDIIAYQDEVGVGKSSADDTAGYYRALREAHDRANRSKLWADMEIFDFEGEVYKSALIPCSMERIQKQLEAVSPYAEEILCYQYQGMLNKTDSKAFCGCSGSTELYKAIKAHNKKYSKEVKNEF